MLDVCLVYNVGGKPLASITFRSGDTTVLSQEVPFSLNGVLFNRASTKTCWTTSF
jgi:hypothetical protein